VRQQFLEPDVSLRQITFKPIGVWKVKRIFAQGNPSPDSAVSSRDWLKDLQEGHNEQPTKRFFTLPLFDFDSRHPAKREAPRVSTNMIQAEMMRPIAIGLISIQAARTPEMAEQTVNASHSAVEKI